MDDQDPEPAESLKQIITENTYIVEPEGYGKVRRTNAHRAVDQSFNDRRNQTSLQGENRPLFLSTFLFSLRR